MKRMKQKLLTLIAIVASCAMAQAQSVAPACPDFTDLTAAHVQATTGSTYNPFAATGVVSGRHTVITSQGSDRNTGGALKLLPAGESRVIKLGNEQVNAQAEAITYRFIVDKDHSVLLLKFAVVMEDPGHGVVEQPRFVVRITDKDGNLLEDCAQYDVSAGGNIPGFQSYNGSYTPVRWRDWTNVGLDMTRFIGSEVQVQFITYDCSQYGHFGYAYFTAQCISNLLEMENCGGSSYTVKAPDNFASYYWDNGDKTQSSTRPASETNKTLTCEVTSATGCQFPLYAYVTASGAPSVSSTYNETICEGDTYTKHNFDIAPQQEPGVKHYYNTYLNPSTCGNGVTDELVLTVVPRYTRIEADLCHGNDYVDNGFEIIQPKVGVRHDTLLITEGSPCNTYKVLKLTVNPALNTPDGIIGDAAPCTGEAVSYTFEGAELLTRYTWELPANAVVLSGRYSTQITLYFTDATPGDIVLRGENGCGQWSKTLHVTPHQSYHLYFSENVCAGSNFNAHGFNLGLQQTEGYSVYNKNMKTVSGCDSTVTLALAVLPKPEVFIRSSETVLCSAGDSVSLFATQCAQPAGAQNLAADEVFIYDCNANDNCLMGAVPTLADDELFISDCSLQYEWSTGETTAAITPTPSTTTTYTVTMTTGTGCTAQASQTIAVNTPTPQTINAAICEGETYTDFGFNHSTAGSYTRSITNGDCAQDITLNLTVTASATRTITGSVCDGETFNQEGLSYTLYGAGNVFRDTLHFVSATGCDSTVFVAITVNANPVTTVFDTICQNEAYNRNGFLLPAQTVAGQFTHSTTTSIAGACKSTTNLVLTVNPVVTNIISDEDTLGNHYMRYGFDYNLSEPGDISETLHLTNPRTGCDSTVILNLKVFCNTKDTVLYDTICSGETYTFGKNLLTEANTYIDSLRTSVGCDSIVTLHLAVNDCVLPCYNFEEVKHDTICNGTEYSWRGQTLALNGVYYDSLKTVIGDCDSVYVLQLTVNPYVEKNIASTICEGSHYDFYGTTLSASGVYTDTIAGVDCDSIVRLNLTVATATYATDTQTACDSYTWIDGNTYTASNFTAQWTLFNVAGCDSIVTLNLTIQHTSAPTELADSIVVGENYTKYGFAIPVQNKASTFTDTLHLQNSNLCDSTVILNLKVLCNSDTTRLSDSIAVGKSYIKHGFVIPKQNAETTLYDTLRLHNQYACDSTVILHLKVQCKPDVIRIYDTISIGESYSEHGFTIPIQPVASTIFDTLFLKNQYLCDSIVALRLTVSCKRKETQLYTTICPGQYYIFDNRNLTESGVYVDTLQSVFLCDSIVTLTLTVEQPPAPIVAIKNVCVGELTPLQAFGSPLVHWISVDKKLPDWVGESYDFDRIGKSDLEVGTYEFELYDIDAHSGCESERVQLAFEVAPAAQPKITGRTELCRQAIEEHYNIDVATQGSKYFWKTSGTQYNYAKDGNPYSPSRYVDWHGVGIDTVYVREQTYAGCEGFDTLVVYIADYPQPFFTWSLQGASTTIEFTDSTYQAPIVAENHDGTHVEIPLTYTMDWFFDNEETPTLLEEYHNRFNPIQVHNYTYGYKYPILTVTNNFGCQARYSTEIFVDVLHGIHIPNAFSPTNAAASVRVFRPVAYNLEYCNVWVYDKWGNLLWYGNRVENGLFVDEWNGTYKGELLQSDTYIWKMEAQFLDGTTWAGQKKLFGGYSNFGSVVLVR